MKAPVELDSHGAWVLYERPFRHIRAHGVFQKSIYGALESEFLAIKDANPADDEAAPRFRPAKAGYGALVYAMHGHIAPRFAPFFERHWIDFLAELLGLPAQPQIDGALHHIPLGSHPGWVHNDFCSAWFDARQRGEVILPDRRSCDYFTGTSRSPEAQPQEFVRAATMIFYLNNDDWKAGCGGETGLYAASQPHLGESVLASPVNNSLLLFECSPHSYHALVGNPGCPRNSIILWLHSTVENASARWGRGWTHRAPK